MIDVHAPHESVHTWSNFFIHIAIITIGLLIAIALEQSVEALHRHRERIQLQHDLRAEAINNRGIIARDLKLQELELWFAQAVQDTDATAPTQGKIHIILPPAPCIPGSVGTATARYFAPSEAVWTTAKESGLVPLLPVEQARMYARLAHNYELLAGSREDLYRGCSAVVALQERFAHRSPNAQTLEWTLSIEQADHLAQLASETRTAIQGLCFRLRWSDVYEQGIVEAKDKEDQRMMTMDQTRFEDPPSDAAPTH